MLDTEIIHKLVEKGIAIKKEALATCLQHMKTSYSDCIFHKNVFAYLLDHCTEEVVKQVLPIIYNNNNLYLTSFIAHYIAQNNNIHLHNDIFLQYCINCNDIKHMEFLIKHGADVSILSACNLYGADSDMVKYLVEKNIISQKVPVLKKIRTGYHVVIKK